MLMSARRMICAVVVPPAAKKARFPADRSDCAHVVIAFGAAPL
jgi:hypothetical protein